MALVVSFAGLTYYLIRGYEEKEAKKEAKKEAVQVEADEERKRQVLITKRVNPLIEKRKNFITDSKLEMIWVKPGTFMMGSPVSEVGRVKPLEIHHQVTLTKGFYLGKYEVTQAQWERVMGNNPSRFKRADRPVENVSWDDAVEFCKKLTEMEKEAGRVPQGMSYQLPTEAQWEYACRAGTSTIYSWGDSISSSNANYDGNVDETTPVGKYPANPWGIHDMHGNVWEWCADRRGNPELYRVIRGGSWDWNEQNLRSAKSGTYPTRSHARDIGFRVGFQSSK
ncbi:MAG: formylglycine-generating enzyme family protein [Opitutales bacterium]